MQVGYEDTEESVDPVIKKKLIVEDTEVTEVGGIEVARGKFIAVTERKKVLRKRFERRVDDCESNVEIF